MHYSCLLISRQSDRADMGAHRLAAALEETAAEPVVKRDAAQTRLRLAGEASEPVRLQGFPYGSVLVVLAAGDPREIEDAVFKIKLRAVCGSKRSHSSIDGERAHCSLPVV